MSVTTDDHPEGSLVYVCASHQHYAFFLTDAPSIHKITANLGYKSVNDDELEIFAFKKRMKLCIHTWQDSQCESSHIHTF